MRIAIIGLGVMGKNHYRVLKTLEGAQVAALCDPVAVIAGEHVYKSPDQMLSEAKPDAAIIAVPTFLHKEIALKCMELGVPVLIEKPVAPTVEEGVSVLSASMEKGVKAAVGHIERFNPVVTALKKELAGKEIYSISITRVGPFPPRIADVGILADLSVHDIDLIRFITGKQIKAVSIHKSKKIINHHEDNAVLSFKLEGDTVASITTNWLTPFKKRKIEAATKDAYYEADLMSQELTEYSSYKENNSFAVRNCFVQKGEPLRNELSCFVGFLKGAAALDLATIEDSIATLEVIKGAG